LATMVSLSKSGSHATLIPVKNMDRAVKFYTETLGGKLQQRMDGEMKDFWASLKLCGCEFWLVAPEERESRELSYDAFMVDDIKATVSDLKGKGVKFNRGEKTSKESRVEGPITFDGVGATAFFKDSEGNLLMLYQSTM
jgi:catechol 2,3-dioxygenase-like lactoylglutathione lyase family enzyme